MPLSHYTNRYEMLHTPKLFFFSLSNYIWTSQPRLVGRPGSHYWSFTLMQLITEPWAYVDQHGRSTEQWVAGWESSAWHLLDTCRFLLSCAGPYHPHNAIAWSHRSRWLASSKLHDKCSLLGLPNHCYHFLALTGTSRAALQNPPFKESNTKTCL